ncbi:hypothetical protein JB92DRAFT_730362 [Gautieria morchelliformis]|nr:hypothetical protein JB92DRAFT_730362 [Gautieria morchelliformis]
MVMIWASKACLPSCVARPPHEPVPWGRAWDYFLVALASLVLFRGCTTTARQTRFDCSLEYTESNVHSNLLDASSNPEIIVQKPYAALKDSQSHNKAFEGPVSGNIVVLVHLVSQ